MNKSIAYQPITATQFGISKIFYFDHLVKNTLCTIAQESINRRNSFFSSGVSDASGLLCNSDTLNLR